MDFIGKLFKRQNRAGIDGIAKRFLQAFEAHNIERAHIPRWLPTISYESLQSEQKLLPGLTPEILDATTRLFGLVPGWLEGLSDLALMPEGERGNSKALLDRLAQALARTKAIGADWNPSPLRAITATPKLQREGNGEQWIVLAIREAIGDRGDGPAYRCQIQRHTFDWSIPEQRIELKAITWLAWHRLRTPVPLYLVRQEELVDIQGGYAIPRVIFHRPIITNPSLEDYIETTAANSVAREIDELESVLAYLDAHGLRDFDFMLPEASPAIEVASLEPHPEAAAPSKPRPPGKRQAQQDHWAAIIAAAQTIWAQEPLLPIASMILQLKRLPHLKAKAFSDSAIHKRISPFAPPEVRGKPGRKPKQSP